MIEAGLSSHLYVSPGTNVSSYFFLPACNKKDEKHLLHYFFVPSNQIYY